jgi:hypothetical protein
VNTDELLSRLRTAYRTKSLRQLAAICELSHEAIRKMVLQGKMNLSVDTYNKIDKGLKEHGL